MRDVRIVVMSDTHVPSRARDLPPELWRAVDAADAVVHAGDWVSADLVDAVTARAPRLVACWGNNDGPLIRAALPEVARAELAGVRLAVVHETGASTGRERRMDRLFPDTDLLVFGHSHVPWDSVTPNGLRLLNPGSPTDKRRQPVGTWVTVELAGGDVRGVTWHEVVRRGTAAAPRSAGRTPGSA